MNRSYQTPALAPDLLAVSLGESSAMVHSPSRSVPPGEGSRRTVMVNTAAPNFPAKATPAGGCTDATAKGMWGFR